MGKCGVLFRSTTPNTSVNTARNSSGLSMDHAAPRNDEVYLTLISLRTRFIRISRWATSSLIRFHARGRTSSEVWTSSSPWRTPLVSVTAIEQLLQRDVQRRHGRDPELARGQADQRRVTRSAGR